MSRLAAITLAVTVAFVLWVGLDPGFRPPNWLGDKLQHVSAFVAITLLAAGTWPEVGLWRLFAGISGFAAAVEAIQWAMALGREADWMDLGVGIAATGVTLGAVCVIRKIRAGLMA